MKNDFYRISITGIVLILLMLSLVATTGANENSTTLDIINFSDSKFIAIYPSPDGTLIDYQMSFDIDYESEMQSDFDDLRFTDENGILLSYWIESKTDSHSAKVWVKVPEIDSVDGAILL